MEFMNKPLVLSIGADGRFAGLVVPELIRRGARVRGLVHRPVNTDRVKTAGVEEVVVGELRDPKSIAAALTGVDCVFYIAPRFARDEAEIGMRLVEEAVKAGVRRIVFSAVIHPVLGALGNHIAKAPVEEAIIASGMEYVLLHPTMFFQNYAMSWPAVVKTGILAEPYSAERRISRVDYRDVAEAAAVALTNDRLLFGTFELCAEGYLNRHDVAALMSEVLKREIKPVTVTFDVWVESLALPGNQDLIDGLRKMFAWYDAHSLLGSAVTLRAVLGREPRTLQNFIGELAAKSPTSA
jgi:uncharacterized protein YbjT (DUF2867 family)